jgi:hypothetical protein
MKNVLVAVGVCLVSVLNLTAQWLPATTPPPADTDPIHRGGNVVIGGPVAFPYTKLTVSNSSDARFDVASQMSGFAAIRIISNNAIYATIDALNGPYDSQPYTIAKNLVLQPNGGNVGIGPGTTTATHLLEIAGANAVASFGSDPAVINVGGQNAFLGGYTFSGLSTAYFSENFLYTTNGGGYHAPNPNDSSALLVLQGGALTFFNTAPGGNLFGNNRLTVTADGRVLVGPAVAGHSSEQLTVNGNAWVQGTLSGTTVRATYQDVAEWVQSSGDMPSGTVVVLNAERSNEVVPSSRAYDTTVAGVVSPAPGVLLGVEGASKAKIATTGRVRVRVNATMHPVKIGDLLVTSDKPGVAMVSEPLDLGGVKIHRPGTLIGKALEPLPSGEGEILVLLSLQ